MTNPTQAQKLASYFWKATPSQSTAISFATNGELPVSIGDYILVSYDIFGWGTSGTITTMARDGSSADGAELYTFGVNVYGIDDTGASITKPLPADTSYVIFRTPTGTPTPTYTIHASTASSFTLAKPFEAPPITDDPNIEPIQVIFYRGTQAPTPAEPSADDDVDSINPRGFLVAGIEPRGNDLHITAVQYNPAAYK